MDVDVAIVNQGGKRAITSFSCYKTPPGHLVVLVGANWDSLMYFLLIWTDLLFFFIKCIIIRYHLKMCGVTSVHITRPLCLLTTSSFYPLVYKAGAGTRTRTRVWAFCRSLDKQ